MQLLLRLIDLRKRARAHAHTHTHGDSHSNRIVETEVDVQYLSSHSIQFRVLYSIQNDVLYRSALPHEKGIVELDLLQLSSSDVVHNHVLIGGG